MRWVKRLIAAAVLSMSTVLAGVGASYGQDRVVHIGFQKYGKLVLLKSKGTLEPKLKALGYSVTWIEFPSGPPLLEAINVGAVDFGNTGDNFFLSNGHSRSSLRNVLCVNRTGVLCGCAGLTTGRGPPYSAAKASRSAGDLTAWAVIPRSSRLAIPVRAPAGGNSTAAVISSSRSVALHRSQRTGWGS